MDNDFYMEETSTIKKIGTLLLVLLIIAALSGAYYFYKNYNKITLRDVTLELGETLPKDPSYYLKSSKEVNYEIDLSNVSVDDSNKVNSTGEYSYTVIINNEEKKGKIIVKDTTPPEAILRELKIGLNEEYDLEDFIISCNDLSIVCTINFATNKDEELSSKVGEHKINLEIKDKYNNSKIYETTLIVEEGYSLSDIKASNEEVTNIYPIDDNWDNIYTIKLDKGLSEDDDLFESTLLEITNFDFQNIYEDTIINQTILTIYNKYNYVIGFSVKLEFDSGVSLYVSQASYHSL